MANWFIVRDGESSGPFSDFEFRRQFIAAEISLDSQIWTEGQNGWQPLSEVSDVFSPPLSTPLDALPGREAGLQEKTFACHLCHTDLPSTDLIELEGHYYCEPCKPELIARLQEGRALHSLYQPAGFWIRWLALLIDGLITGVANFIISTLLFLPFGSDPDAFALIMFTGIVSWVLNIALSALYETWFVARFAGTPGKLVLGIQVLRPDGSRLTFLRSLGRHFAKYISGFVLMIGYLMAAFDEEKRTLHDIMCDTRVVRK